VSEEVPSNLDPFLLSADLSVCPSEDPHLGLFNRNFKLKFSVFLLEAIIIDVLLSM